MILRSIKHRIQKFAQEIGQTAIRSVGLSKADDTIILDAQQYWTSPGDASFFSNSHWKGEHGLTEETWHALGKIHLDMFENFSGLTGLSLPCERIVEWGCGGGANAVHFAGLTREFVGIDVSQSSLDECAQVMRAAGHHNFLPVLIEIAAPEMALDLVPLPCDFFLCTYVFELIPSPEYGRRLVEIGRKLLRPGGVALIQIKYATHEQHTRSRHRSYRDNLANMTTYPIHAFWELTLEAGLKPRYVVLYPKQPLVHDERYAYFALERPA